jgi:hypothetical protein
LLIRSYTSQNYNSSSSPLPKDLKISQIKAFLQISVMLIPTGQEVMMPCPKPCCCCPQQSSGGCGGMMGKRKRRSLALYRRGGLYERLAASELAQAQAQTAAAYGTAFARAKFAAAAKSQAAAYGCVPCACPPTDSGVSPLSRLLNPQKYKV